jgi:regulator of protease activity HflC (stomatin/prohibitin superfamily)
VIGAAGKRVESWIDRHFIGVTTTAIFLLFFVIYFASSIFITIPAGHGGALWLRFFQGTVMNFHYDEGTKIIFPWDKIYIYDLRVQQESEQVDMLTKEGLQISVNITLRFRLRREGLSAITAYAGPNFVKSLVMPSVGAVVRLEGAKYNLQDIFSTDRHQIELSILKALSEVVKNLIPGELHQGAEIVILDFWFRGIQLPASLQAAIEAKLAQSQLVEQYVFILQREAQEKERKIIEAQGIKAFQDTVSQGISENYLRWKGIDATLKLADSPNAKIVVIGGKEGLPLILGPMGDIPGAVAGAPPASPASGAAITLPPPVSTMTPSSLTKGTAAGMPSSLSNPRPNAQGASTEPLALNPTISMPVVPLDSR